MHDLILRPRFHSFSSFAGLAVVTTAAVILSALPLPIDHFRPFAMSLSFLTLVGVMVFGAVIFPEARRWLAAWSLVLTLLVLMTIFAHAADGAPETVAQAASDTTKVTWAWGAVVQQWASSIDWLALCAISYAAVKIGGPIGAVLSNSRVQTLIFNGVNYGINAVEGAVAGKTLDVNVGNAVLAKALQYALDNSSSWLQSWAGGPLGIAKKIWAVLNLGEGVSDDQLEAIVAQVTAK